MRNFVLTRFAAAFFMELRLICWHWSYLLLHILWAALIFGNLAGRDMGTAQNTLEQGMIPIVRTMVSGIALFVTGASYARAIRTRFIGIDDTLPTRFEVHLGRWAASTTAILGFIIEPLVLAGLSGPIQSLMIGLIPYLLGTIIPLTAATALAWLIVSRLSIRRWIFPLLAAIWLALITLPSVLPRITIMPFRGLFNFSGNGNPITYTELFGTMPQGALPFWFNLFYLALAVLLVGLVMTRYQRRRFYRVARASLTVTLIAALVALFAVVGYSRTVSAAQGVESADAKLHEEFSASLVRPGEAQEMIQSYDLSVDLSEVTRPRFVARIQILNRGTAPLETLHLTLSRDLIIDQASVPITRDRDFLTLTPSTPLDAGATLSVEMTYSGAVWRSTTVFGGVPMAVDFANADGVSLTSDLGWYPRAGWFVPRGYSPEKLEPPPASFTVRISGAAEMQFASNLSVVTGSDDRTFASTSADELMIIGSPRLARSDVGTSESGTITVIAAQYDMASFKRSATNIYVPTMQQIRRFFPYVNIAGLQLFGTEQFTLYPIYTLNDGWILDSKPRFLLVRVKPDHVYERVSLITRDLIVPLFASSLYDVRSQMPGADGIRVHYPANTGLLDGIALFITLHELTNGDSVAIQTWLDEIAETQEADTNRAYGNYVNLPVAQALSTIYSQGGEAAVIRALKQARLRQADLLALPSDQLDGWLKAAASVE